MHSRIFQVSKEPIRKEDWIEEDRYYDGFVSSVAEYVETVGDPEEDYDWLGTSKGLEVDLETKTLKIVSKEEYFKGAYNNFKEQVEKCSEVSLEDFISGRTALNVFRISQSYEDDHGFYIDDNGENYGITTLDDFVRCAPEGDVFYLGAVTDYHF